MSIITEARPKDWPSYLDLPKPKSKPPTQFDHIRSLSDEELAKFLWEQNGSNRYWKSVEKYIEWGKQPYKEDGK